MCTIIMLKEVLKLYGTKKIYSDGKPVLKIVSEYFLASIVSILVKSPYVSQFNKVELIMN